MQPQQWAGPLSRELLVFNSFPRAVSKSFRQLLEAISVHMLLSGAAKKHREEYPELMLSGSSCHSYLSDTRWS